MKKIKWILLNIISFGGVYFWTKAKAKNVSSQNNQIKLNSKIKFSISEFIDEFGGKNNIKNITSTISTIKIELNNQADVDQNKLAKFGVSGLIKGNNSYVVVLGDIAKTLAEEIQKKIR